MNHGKTTLLFGSIVVAGALTGVVLAILLKQFLDDREKDLSVIGTLGNSVAGKNDVVKSAYGPSASSVNETTSSNGGTTNR
jgi:F0F1-type ATP synthase assembly protein I